MFVTWRWWKPDQDGAKSICQEWRSCCQLRRTQPSSSRPSCEVAAGRGVDVAVRGALQVSIRPEGGRQGSGRTGASGQESSCPALASAPGSKRPPLVTFGQTSSDSSHCCYLTPKGSRETVLILIWGERLGAVDSRPLGLIPWSPAEGSGWKQLVTLLLTQHL